jgi:hypothetical protein
MRATTARPRSPRGRTFTFDDHCGYVIRADGDWAKFARLFRRAWRVVPVAARERLRRYWGEPKEGYIVYPRIALVSGIPPIRVGNGIAHATCSQLGGELMFSALSMEVHGDEFFVGIVLHELAHAYHWATGEWSQDEVTEELRTRRLVVEWLAR